MSLSGALNNAISGLTAAKRSAQVVSSNLANVMTDGYGHRSIELQANTSGGTGGVRVTGVTRQENPALIAELRVASADRASQDELLGFYSKLETLVGVPSDASSLSARLSQLEADLTTAASRPDQSGRLDNAVQSAKAVVQKLNDASRGLQDIRVAADRKIAGAVDTLNTKLSQIEELNAQIAAASAGKRETAGYLDQRQILIDEVSEWIPLKQMSRENGMVALYSVGGVALVDGRASELSFTPTNTIAPHMTQDNGLLSGLSVNGRDVSTDAERGALRGGRLSAMFELRDRASVEAQAELDAFARDLAERFQAAGLDATRAAGETGLFTDAGALVESTNEVGLAGRLEVNALVDAARGGDSSRLRDGLGAISEGPLGNAALLQGFVSALSGGAATPSGRFAGQVQSASGLIGQIASLIGSDRLNHEQELSFAASRATAAETMLASEGVDTDQEMQRLMMIEQAYSANAQMLKTVDEMMDTLMRAI